MTEKGCGQENESWNLFHRKLQTAFLPEQKPTIRDRLRLHHPRNYVVNSATHSQQRLLFKAAPGQREYSMENRGQTNFNIKILSITQPQPSS